MNKFFLYLLLAFCGVTMFSCEKELSLENYNQQKAGGSLWDSSGNCMPDSVHGTFYNGVLSGSDTAFVEIKVNVTQTGSYSILSSLENGFQFADSGFFTTTGINTIRLKQLGIPIIPTTSTFSISFDSSVCSFSVVIKDSTGTGLGGNQNPPGNTGSNYGDWQFTTAAGTFAGTFDTAVIIKDTSIWNSGGQMLVMEGFKTNTNDSAIALYVYLPTGNIVTGTYSTQAVPPANAGLFAFLDFDLTTGDGTPIYESSSDTAPTSSVVINITSYDSGTGVVKGTFSGNADDSNSTAVAVSNGSFTATVTH